MSTFTTVLTVLLTAVTSAPMKSADQATAGLSSSLPSEATAAFGTLTEADSSAIEALVAEFENISEFQGICGSRSLQSQAESIDLADLGKEPPAGWTRPPEVREVSLYLLLAILGKGPYFAETCRLETEGSNQDHDLIGKALDEIRTLYLRVRASGEPFEVDQVEAAMQSWNIAFEGTHFEGLP